MNTCLLLPMIGVIEGSSYSEFCPTILLYKISGQTVPPTIFTSTCNFKQFYRPKFFILGLNYPAVIHLMVDTVGRLLFQAIYLPFLPYLFWVKMWSTTQISELCFLFLSCSSLTSLSPFLYHILVTQCLESRLRAFYFFWAHFYPPLFFFSTGISLFPMIPMMIK